MTNETFIRARSHAHKEVRLQEIKDATEALSRQMSYQDISVAAIARRLGRTRPSIYKYFSSKAEIFMALYQDHRKAYFDGLEAAFPAGCGYSPEVAAEVWTGILCAHVGYLGFSRRLVMVTEDEIPRDRLSAFVAGFFQRADGLASVMSGSLGLPRDVAGEVILTVHIHALGILEMERLKAVAEGSQRGCQDPPPSDFRGDMKRFILTCLRAARADAGR